MARGIVGNDVEKTQPLQLPQQGRQDGIKTTYRTTSNRTTVATSISSRVTAHTVSPRMIGSGVARNDEGDRPFLHVSGSQLGLSWDVAATTLHTATQSRAVGQSSASEEIA